MTDPNDFIAKAKAQMDAWSADMAKMQDKMMKSGKDAQDQMSKQMEASTAQRKQIEAQLEDMAKANMAAAKDVQANVEKAWADMEKQIAEARKKMMG